MTTDRQNDVEDLIAALRDDLPSRDDERRVRARLLAGGMALGSLTVAQLGSAAAASNTAASSTAVASTVASSSMVASGAASAAATSAGAAGSLSIAAGTAGTQGLAAVFGKAALVTLLALGAGYPVVSQLLPPTTPAPAPAALVKADGAAKAAPPVLHAERRTEARALAKAEPRPAPQAEVSSRSTRKPEARAVLPAPAKAASSPEGETTTPPAGTVEQNTATRASTLEAETALIERALRAARRGDNDDALGWLSEHQSRYPNGALAPERQRALEQLRRP